MSNTRTKKMVEPVKKYKWCFLQRVVKIKSTIGQQQEELNEKWLDSGRKALLLEIIIEICATTADTEGGRVDIVFFSSSLKSPILPS